MPAEYRTVNLLSNYTYPTYQFFAQMENVKTTPEEGLRLAGLTVMQWLSKRMGDNTPDILKGMPSPDQFQEVNNDCLIPMNINQGYTLDIISIPEQGIWSMQLSEPDLGSDPGNAAQARQPIAGRIIVTNIAFRINDNALECGFNTEITDPNNVEKADVYRMAFIRELMNNPHFGFRQIVPVNGKVSRIVSKDALSRMMEVWHHPNNQMPIIVFTQLEKTEKTPELSDLMEMSKNMPFYGAGVSKSLPFVELEDKKVYRKGNQSIIKVKVEEPKMTIKKKTHERIFEDPEYDMERFAYSGSTFYRTYLLEKPIEGAFSIASGIQIEEGDILILEPNCYGGAVTKEKYRPSSERRKSILDQLKKKYCTYTRDRYMSYGGIAFWSEAKEILIHMPQEIRERHMNIQEKWKNEAEQQKSEWQKERKELYRKNQQLLDQNKRLNDYLSDQKAEMGELREAHQEEIDHLKDEIQSLQDIIEFMKKRQMQPNEHRAIAAWVEEQYRGQLVLHEKAVALLERNDATGVDVKLICDALDFLANDYREYVFFGLSEEDMNERCSQKYGRPFRITPTGSGAIEAYSGDYKIKYFVGPKGKKVESPLNYHLKVGTSGENLLRIYFLLDKDKQLIVVGSLPKHLRTMSVNS